MATYWFSGIWQFSNSIYKLIAAPRHLLHSSMFAGSPPARTESGTRRTDVPVAMICFLPRVHSAAYGFEGVKWIIRIWLSTSVQYRPKCFDQVQTWQLDQFGKNSKSLIPGPVVLLPALNLLHPSSSLPVDLGIRWAVEQILLSVRLRGAAGARLYRATTIVNAVIRFLNTCQCLGTKIDRASSFVGMPTSNRP